MDDAKPARLPRGGSVAKRQAVLNAARELFVTQGVDRVSMDTVAAKAQVSKATVYGYFGDKQRLFRAILADASESLDQLAQQALETHLGEGAGITSLPQLERALTATAIDIGAAVVGSIEYAAVLALAAQRRWQDPEFEADVETAAAETAFAERLVGFAEAGLLDIDDPRRAADHFFALTILLASNEQPNPLTVNSERLRRTIIDGAHAFVRAYAPR